MTPYKKIITIIVKFFRTVVIAAIVKAIVTFAIFLLPGNAGDSVSETLYYTIIYYIGLTYISADLLTNSLFILLLYLTGINKACLESVKICILENLIFFVVSNLFILAFISNFHNTKFWIRFSQVITYEIILCASIWLQFKSKKKNESLVKQ